MTQTSAIKGARRSVWIVAFPGFELLDLSGPLCAFGIAGGLWGAPYAVTVASANGGRIRCSAGVPIDTVKARARGRIDTLLVVGGPLTHTFVDEARTVATLKRLSPKSRRVASVCTGAFLLAAAGLLDGRSATTHWRHAGSLQARFPKIRVRSNSIFVKDRDLWTSAGITSGIDLALALIEEDFGSELSKAVAREMVVHHRRSGNQSQFSLVLELEPKLDRIRDALHFAHEHLHEILSVERLADAVHVSPRQFARLFVRETGVTPARAVERLRVEEALSRIEQGTDPLEAIARSVGFGNLERMRRAFVGIYGQSPQALRRLARKSCK